MLRGPWSARWSRGYEIAPGLRDDRMVELAIRLRRHALVDSFYREFPRSSVTRNLDSTVSTVNRIRKSLENLETCDRFTTQVFETQHVHRHVGSPRLTHSSRLFFFFFTYSRLIYQTDGKWSR